MLRPSATWPSGSGRPRGVFDLATKEERVAELDARASEPDFWDDQRAAQKVLREAEGLRAEATLWRALQKRAEDLVELVGLLEETPDAETEADVEREAADLQAQFERERTLLLFSGDYDAKSAVLTISAGAGGTEATDWADMLLRMYLRWSERHRFRSEVVDSQEGEQAGIKSATVTVDGRFAYGWLRAERGVHRLVRISPYDAQKRRQTTFALVEVMPEADEDVEIELNWDEIRVDTFRSSGAGGQHVKKTEFGYSPHAPADRDRRDQPERAVGDPEQRDRHPGPQVAAPGAGAGEKRGGAAQAAGRARDRRLGQPDP